YDAAGNMTFDATANLSYSFDQENRLTGSAGYTYTYDGDGNRVRKSNGNLAANGTLYWAMTPGVVAETDLAGTAKSEYIFFDGERVARRDGATGTGGVFYYFSDHLKTASVITDAAGTIKAESDYYPWGGELQFTNNDSNDYKFTGKKRDAETGLDYFGARYYSNGMGRWVSADWSAKPEAVPYSKLDDPQSLNLYQYVGNNPLSQRDDDGHEIIYADGLKNAQVVKDSVQAILANPNTSANLSGYVGSNNPNLTIQSGDLGPPKVETLPNGQTMTTQVQGDTAPNIITTTSSSTDTNGVTTTGAPVTTLTDATITIDNRTSKGDTPGVMVHESVHAGEAKANPAQFAKDAKAEQSLPHDQRPQEQRANAAQKTYGPQIKKEVKQIEEKRKKEKQ
ncbi:MAG TPA: RHS repeat-associated core domain-containing protein, partial [Candidatus Angelobacter sp.]